MSIQKKIRTKKGKQVTYYFPVVSTYSVNSKSENIWGKGYLKKSDALAAEAELKASLSSDSLKVRENKNIQFVAVRKKWLQTRVTKEKPTQERDKAYCDTYLSTFDDFEINKITSLMIQEWVNMLTESYAPKTVRLAFDLLSQVFAYAIQPIKAITANPCAENIQLPKIRKKGVESSKYWTQEQINYFFSHPLVLKDHYYNAYAIQAICGARPGEVCGLSVDDISLTHQTLTFNYGLDRKARHTNLKNSGAQRTLKIPPRLIPYLEKQMHISEYLREPNDKYRFLIVQNNGKCFTPDAYGKHLKKLIARINKYENELAREKAENPVDYQDKEFLAPISPYGFRHTFATLSLLNGIHMKVVAENMGDTVETVMQNYAHVVENLSADSLIKMTSIINLP